MCQRLVLVGEVTIPLLLWIIHHDFEREVKLALLSHNRSLQFSIVVVVAFSFIGFKIPCVEKTKQFMPSKVQF